MIHPDDANGDALRRLEADGDNLSLPRNIDFTVVFADQSAAEKFAESIAAQGYPASVEKADVEEGFSWDVLVVKHMNPLYEEIIGFEDLLESIAKPLGGSNDGWGCFAITDACPSE